MVTVTICSDFGAPKKSLSLYCFPIYLPWSYGAGCLLLFLCNNKKPFLDQTVMCNEKWIVYDNLQQPAQWLDWEEAPKPFPKPNLHQKRSWPLFGGLLPIWFTSVFWIQVKPLQLITMLCKSLWCTENFSTCSCQQKGPNSSSWLFLTAHCTTNSSKVEWIGLQSFASSAILTWPLTKQLPLLQASWQLF